MAKRTDTAVDCGIAYPDVERELDVRLDAEVRRLVAEPAAGEEPGVR
ncbi:hypothetical protein ABZ636_01625 [Streptomyces sp. NPDC007251]